MTLQQVVLLSFVLSTIQVYGAGIKPIDLADDAQVLLEDLSQIVLGNIIAAHSEINDIATDILSYRINVERKAELSIQQEEQVIEQELNVVKELAVHKNITSCLDPSESVLVRLPTIFLAELHLCIGDTETEANDIIKEHEYNVDITINDVHSIEFQLARCDATDSACISTIISQIKSATIDVPVKIKIEVNRATAKSETLKVSIEKCADTNVAAYAREANAVFLDIVTCINRS